MYLFASVVLNCKILLKVAYILIFTFDRLFALDASVQTLIGPAIAISFKWANFKICVFNSCSLAWLPLFFG